MSTKKFCPTIKNCEGAFFWQYTTHPPTVRYGKQTEPENFFLPTPCCYGCPPLVDTVCGGGYSAALV